MFLLIDYGDELEFAGGLIVKYFADGAIGGEGPLGEPIFGSCAAAELEDFHFGPCGLELLEGGGWGVC